MKKAGTPDCNMHPASSHKNSVHVPEHMLACTHTDTHTHTHTHSLAGTHTHAHTHMHAHSHSHTHTLTLTLSHTPLKMQTGACRAPACPGPQHALS
mmetsp:Transcript_1204/g.2592  ORF Transcript_1204/g.2592 Transcript_1204/m.2592 type:complete len:96 (+) Transcript_1204:212-499(+)